MAGIRSLGTQAAIDLHLHIWHSSFCSALGSCFWDTGEVESKGLCDFRGDEYKETWDSDLWLKDWENLLIILLDWTGKEIAEWISVAECEVDDALNVDWTPWDLWEVAAKDLYAFMS